MSCDVDKPKEGLEMSCMYVKRRKAWRMSSAMTITISFAHSPSFPLLHLHHISFSNPSLALSTSRLSLKPFRPSPTSQHILVPFFRFSYVTGFSLMSPGEPPTSPTLPLLQLRHSSFSNPSFAFPTLQDFHLPSSGEPPMRP